MFSINQESAGGVGRVELGIRIYDFNAAKELNTQPRTVLSSYFPSEGAAGAWQKGNGVAMSPRSTCEVATEPAAETLFPAPEQGFREKVAARQASAGGSRRSLSGSWQGISFPWRTLLIKTNRAQGQSARLTTQISKCS